MIKDQLIDLIEEYTNAKVDSNSPQCVDGITISLIVEKEAKEKLEKFINENIIDQSTFN